MGTSATLTRHNQRNHHGERIVMRRWWKARGRLPYPDGEYVEGSVLLGQTPYMTELPPDQWSVGCAR